MAIQLASDPKIKINGEELNGYLFTGFKLTKRLLEPNRFEFILRKEDMTLTQEDIKFELRENLLGSLVECSLSANRVDVEGDCQTDVVDNFFKGYIQHIKVERKDNKAPFELRCIAFSPDSRLKQFPSCSSRVNATLGKYAADIIYGPAEGNCKFDVPSGRYDDSHPIQAFINPRYNDPMPYTVQYHESGYEFLKRLAKRYGEFFYYEDGTLYFGEMKEYDAVTLRTGIDLENYNYDLNMNEHLGIVLTEFDYIDRGMERLVGRVKWGKGGWKQTAESYHEMSQSAFNHSIEFFNDDHCMVSDSRSARMLKEPSSREFEKNDNVFWAREQHDLLEKYVMADTLICSGDARRADLKLGSVIVIEDETNTGPGASTEMVQHEPLKVIDLVYTWDSKKDNRSLVNHFKAIPQKATVPPYLERDSQGFLTYGDFDIFPYSGPQHGRVVDNKDPLGLGRVQVVMSWQFRQEYCNDQEKDIMEVAENRTPWIRVSQPYGGHERGCYIVPEIFDEVIVGFEHNNAERPYVMGTVHNNWNDKVDAKWGEDSVVQNNEFKSIRTRNGHTIEIRDKGKHGYIKIYDNVTHNYVVTLDTDRSLIKLESAGNIELEAKQDIVMHAGNDIIMNADRDINEAAENDVKVNAGNDMIKNAGNDMRLEAGNDMVQGSENDFAVHSVGEMNVSSGKDMLISSEGSMFPSSHKDFELVVDGEGDVLGKKGFVADVKEGVELKAGKSFEFKADDIIGIAQKEFSEYSEKHNIKAQDGIKINATVCIDLKARSIREN